MATWSVRTAAGTREGLTVYQLQQLVRLGEVGAADEVLTEGSWRRVDAVPQLSAHLPSAPAPSDASTSPKTLRIGNVELELGPDGKPLPPPPEVIAQLLSQDMGERRPHWGWKAALYLGAAAVGLEVAYSLWTVFGP